MKTAFRDLRAGAAAQPDATHAAAYGLRFLAATSAAVCVLAGVVAVALSVAGAALALWQASAVTGGAWAWVFRV